MPLSALSQSAVLRWTLGLAFAGAATLTSILAPPDPGTAVRYFRGVCSAGMVDAPCNIDTDCGAGGVCGATADTADDTTSLLWDFVVPPPVDLYRGSIGPGVSKGVLDPAFAAFPAYILNVDACFLADIFVGGTGLMSQVIDPNPPSGFATYYVSAQDLGPGGLPNGNEFGCSNPSLCNNHGWCELGATPGAPCNVDIDCPGGGVCTHQQTFCARDAGPAKLGGCARHAICVAGIAAGRLCLSNVDCPGAVCIQVPDDAVTPGQLCFNVSGGPIFPGNGCLAPGHPKRIISTIDPAVLAACP